MARLYKQANAEIRYGLQKSPYRIMYGVRTKYASTFPKLTVNSKYTTHKSQYQSKENEIRLCRYCAVLDRCWDLVGPNG